MNSFTFKSETVPLLWHDKIELYLYYVCIEMRSFRVKNIMKQGEVIIVSNVSATKRRRKMISYVHNIIYVINKKVRKINRQLIK